MSKHLLKLAKKIPGDWRMLAKFLDIEDCKIEEICLDYPHKVVWQAYMMLKYWLHTAQSWRVELRGALEKMERFDLSETFAGDDL